MSKWLSIHPKVAAAFIVAIILIFGGPQLKALGIDVTGYWNILLPVLAGYLMPSSFGGNNG